MMVLWSRARLVWGFLLALVSGSVVVVSLATNVSAEELVTSLSSNQIEIASNFDGSEIVIFGSIERSGGAAARSGYDIIITATGPSETVVARRKEQVLGLWINQGSRQFSELPSYYAVLSSQPLEDVTTDQLAERYRLGLNTLPTQGARISNAPAEDQKFIDALFRLKMDEELYHYDNMGVTFLSPRLFRATLELPANVPVGDYVVSVNLFADSARLASDEQTFLISKVGFERAMYDFSKNQSLLYGLATIVIAIFTGWLAGVIFRRD